MDDELRWCTLTELAGKLRRREVSPVEVLEAQLEAISADDADLHAYATVLDESARRSARDAENAIASGSYLGPLHGVPVAVKDLCFTRGVRTACGSTLMDRFVPDHDAHVVRRLADAGAVLVGKVALTEFAMTGYPRGASPPVNPRDPSRYTGMSSSGSAVAACAGLAYATIGTDTGGSIRFPSAACGVVGLKPTYGRVSRAGVFPLAPSMDHVGPMARSVADVAAVLDAIAGFDADDPTTMRSPPPSCSAAIGKDARGLRVGIDDAYVSRMTQPTVVDGFHRAVKVLATTGATIVPVKVPPVDDVLHAWPVLCGAEALVGHAGLFPERAAEYGLLFRTMLEWATTLSSATVARATLMRAHWVGRFAGVFDDVDVIACPSASTEALPASMALAEAPFTPAIAPFMRFTAPMDFSGNPTLSVPHGGGTRPDSLQLVGRHGEEATLCRLGDAFEQAVGRIQPPSLPARADKGVR
jgi:amidase